jgi:E3 ubiquitin-protein ligase HECTD1
MVPLQRDSTPVSMEEKEKKEETPMEVDDPAEPKGDPEVAPRYVQRLLPVFTNVFQSSMIQSIR